MTLANSDSLDMDGVVYLEDGSWKVKYVRSVGPGLNVFSLPLDPDDVLSLDKSFLGRETPVRFYVDRVLLPNSQTTFVAKIKTHE